MKIIEVKNDSFKKEVLDYKGTVLVDFNATWCGPCRMLKPIIEELANERNDIKFVGVDIDEAEGLSEKYGVYSIPCLVLFKDGQEIDRSIGLKSKDEINKILGDK